MALKAVKPRLASVKPRLARADASGHDPVMHAFRKLYFTYRWKELRSSVLKRDGYTCRRCGHRSYKGMICDHIEPHRHRDEALFWSANNLQTLCASCHSSAKQKIEKADRFR